MNCKAILLKFSVTSFATIIDVLLGTSTLSKMSVFNFFLAGEKTHNTFFMKSKKNFFIFFYFIIFNI
jgi:hypothetical protein